MSRFVGTILGIGIGFGVGLGVIWGFDFALGEEHVMAFYVIFFVAFTVIVGMVTKNSLVLLIFFLVLPLCVAGAIEFEEASVSKFIESCLLSVPYAGIGGIAGYGMGRRAQAQRQGRPTATYVPPGTFGRRPSREASSKPSRTRISFSDINTTRELGSGDVDLADLNDAFTGESLNPALGLYQCLHCKVYYHRSSVTFLKSHNNGACVACFSTNIVPATADVARKSGRKYDAGVVTLEDYRKHIGHVVTFLGTVQRVSVSRNRKHYALMFENKPWRRGFKMVVFASNVPTMGGRDFLYSLVGRTIRIRGLLRYHRVFGYEIIATSKSMILDVGVAAEAGG